MFPLRIASLSGSLRNGAFRTRLTVTGQLKGMSVPYTTWPDAHLGHQMTQSLFGKNHRVDENLRLQILTGFPLVRAVRVAAHHARRFRPSKIRRQIAAGVRRADTETGKLVERPVENQSRQEVGCFERVADDVAEIARLPECARFDDVLGSSGCMKTSTPSSAAFAQNGSYFGSERSSPFTCPPIEAPRRPRRLTPSWSCPAPTRDAARRRMPRQSDRGGSSPISPVPRSGLERSGARDPVGGVPPIPVDGERLNVNALLIHHRAGAAGPGCCSRHRLPTWPAKCR